MQDNAVGIDTAEYILRQPVDFRRTEAAAEDIIEEEVVQLVRTDEIFRLLGNVALVVGWRQLG